MHEYSIAYDIFLTAKKTAEENNAISIHKIHVDVGELSMINSEQVIFLFSAIAEAEEEPLFKDVELVCTTVKPETTCTCGYKGNEIYVCPKCGALPTIVKGKEILVTNIEIEADEK